MAKILSIVAPEMFQEIEYRDSKMALEQKGHEVFMASSASNPTDKQGQAYQADVLLSEVRQEDYDAIMFIGGPGSQFYYDDPTCHKLARDFFKADKPVAAICAAPVILGQAGLLKGVKSTCWSGESRALLKVGAVYTGKHVEKDGQIITGDGPGSAYDFGIAIAEAFS
ncbi:DJ-1/PfpI family protein [Candidatus Peregrinibacteria bacterium]|nr:DJ-1/PfpI family protein [Candidatus Peregrinibacteria bacterium]